MKGLGESHYPEGGKEVIVDRLMDDKKSRSSPRWTAPIFSLMGTPGGRTTDTSGRRETERKKDAEKKTTQKLDGCSSSC
jgi:hypothetical protein